LRSTPTLTLTFTLTPPQEHDVALKFFQRAIQLQPDLAYAYTWASPPSTPNPNPGRPLTLTPTLAPTLALTLPLTRLSGHEYSANDDFEKAMACYRMPHRARILDW